MRQTQALVRKLIEYGVIKYSLAHKVCNVSVTAVENWNIGKFDARKKHLDALMTLYDRKCQELGKGLYEK